MRSGKVLLVVLLLLLCPNIARPAVPTSYDDIVAKFFDLISTGKTSDAVDFLFKTNPYSDKITDGIQQTKSSLAATEALVGSYRGSSLVLRKEMGDRVAYLYYLVSYDRQPMTFEFYFYKPTDRWVLQNFNVSDKILQDIRDTAKQELLQTLR